MSQLLVSWVFDHKNIPSERLVTKAREVMYCYQTYYNGPNMVVKSWNRPSQTVQYENWERGYSNLHRYFVLPEPTKLNYSLENNGDLWPMKSSIGGSLYISFSTFWPSLIFLHVKEKMATQFFHNILLVWRMTSMLMELISSHLQVPQVQTIGHLTTNFDLHPPCCFGGVGDAIFVVVRFDLWHLIVTFWVKKYSKRKKHIELVNFFVWQCSFESLENNQACKRMWCWFSLRNSLCLTIWLLPWDD